MEQELKAGCEILSGHSRELHSVLFRQMCNGSQFEMSRTSHLLCWCEILSHLHCNG